MKSSTIFDILCIVPSFYYPSVHTRYPYGLVKWCLAFCNWKRWTYSIVLSPSDMYTYTYIAYSENLDDFYLRVYVNRFTDGIRLADTHAHIQMFLDWRRKRARITPQCYIPIHWCMKYVCLYVWLSSMATGINGLQTNLHAKSTTYTRIYYHRHQKKAIRRWATYKLSPIQIKLFWKR